MFDSKPEYLGRRAKPVQTSMWDCTILLDLIDQSVADIFSSKGSAVMKL